MSDLKFWIPNTAIVNADCKDLMGAKISFVCNEGTKVIQGIVAGVDPYIGISIVREDNPKVILFCYHGPFDPGYRERYLERSGPKERYNHNFPIVLAAVKEAVKTGKFDNDRVIEFLSGAGGGNGVCPFGV